MMTGVELDDTGATIGIRLVGSVDRRIGAELPWMGAR
ncbi:MAG: hypothetical protein ACJAZO_003157 [Myxococcota bacterium]|jgi:hypothetical protein